MSKYVNIDISDEKLLQIVQEQTADTDTFITVRRILNALPKEEVAPVVHAHWTCYKSYGGEFCSNCGAPRPLIGGKYCTHCGAKMDEEENEE